MQETASTLFLGAPMTTLRRFVAVAGEVAPRRCAACCMNFRCSQLQACNGQHSCNAPVTFYIATRTMHIQDSQTWANNTTVHSKSTIIPDADWVNVQQFALFCALGIFR